MSWYGTQIKKPQWQKKRLEILSRDEWKCTLCGDTEEELHVHHKSYKGKPWQAENSELQTVCKDCHNLVSSMYHPVFPILETEIIKIIHFKPRISYCNTVDGTYLIEKELCRITKKDTYNILLAFNPNSPAVKSLYDMNKF